ncbi:hypothetical protein BaRGS_00022148 [Batillaria attramentaria]|uniref:Uncharacterized protein n=1 Tax=Batillaria attramentaria TaxID=370345 RepID=A0ABD0KHB5_9CAEN
MYLESLKSTTRFLPVLSGLSISPAVAVYLTEENNPLMIQGRLPMRKNDSRKLSPLKTYSSQGRNKATTDNLFRELIHQFYQKWGILLPKTNTVDTGAVKVMEDGLKGTGSYSSAEVTCAISLALGVLTVVNSGAWRNRSQVVDNVAAVHDTQ